MEEFKIGDVVRIESKKLGILRIIKVISLADDGYIEFIPFVFEKEYKLKLGEVSPFRHYGKKKLNKDLKWKTTIINPDMINILYGQENEKLQ